MGAEVGKVTRSQGGTTVRSHVLVTGAASEWVPAPCLPTAGSPWVGFARLPLNTSARGAQPHPCLWAIGTPVGGGSE